MTAFERVRLSWSGFGTRRRWLVAIGLALLISYVAAGFLLVPAVIVSQVHKQVPKALHRAVRLDAARFNPFTLKTSLIGFRMLDRDSSLLLGFDTLVINVSVLSIPKRALVLDEIRLIRPAMVARLLPDGRPAIHDLLESDSTAPAADSLPAAAIPRFAVRHVALVGGHLDFVDESRSPKFELHATDLSAQVGGFSTLLREQGEHVLTIQLSNGARIDWRGTSTMQPLLLKGRVSLSKLPLHRLAEALAGQLPLELRDGQADLTLDYQVDHAADSIRVGITGASLVLSNLAVRPRGVREDWLRIPQLAIRGVSAGWPQRVAHVSSLRVTDLWVTAARDTSGRVSWQQYLDRMKPDSAAAPRADTAASAPWTAVIDTVELANGSVVLADRKNKPAAELAVTGILVRLTNVTMDSTQRIGVTTGATLGGHGRFSATGAVVRSPLRADLDLALEGLDLSLARPYLAATPLAHLDSGVLSVRGKLHLRANPQALFEGEASVERLAVKDSAGDPMVSWRALAVRNIRFTKGPDLVRIRQVAIDRPFARIAISREGKLNFSSPADSAPEDTTAPRDTTASAGFPFEVQGITITNGQVDFSDQSLVLPFRTLIDSLHGSIRDVASFGGTAGTLDIAGRVGAAGSVGANGSIRLTDPLEQTSIAGHFRNVELSTFTPYSAQFMGYSIRSGVLDVDVRYHIVDRHIEAEHHIVATNLNLGDKVDGGESPGFDVRLAISLMKDNRGRITIDAPVEGSADDPEFSYSGIMFDGVKNAMSRVVTAPFRFLGGTVGIGGGNELELVDFDPGHSALLVPERVKLDTLAAELARRPELTIGIQGRYDSLADPAAVRESQLNARIAARRDSVAGATRGDTSSTVLAGILDALYAEHFGRPGLDSLKARFAQGPAALLYREMHSRLLAVQRVEAGFLERLARSRSAAIRTALLGSGRVDSARITVAEPAAATRKKTGSNRVASEMTMGVR